MPRALSLLAALINMACAFNAVPPPICYPLSVLAGLGVMCATHGLIEYRAAMDKLQSTARLESRSAGKGLVMFDVVFSNDLLLVAYVWRIVAISGAAIWGGVWAFVVVFEWWRLM